MRKLKAGEAAPFDLAQARTEARAALTGIRNGVDPKETQAAKVQEAQRRSESTLGLVAERRQELSRILARLENPPARPQGGSSAMGEVA